MYRRADRRIKLPNKEKLEMLIAFARKPLNIKLQMSMETGLRPVELCNLKVKDIDLTQRLVYPTTAKSGSSRTLKISNTLTAQIIDHITSNSLTPNDKLFKGTAENYSKYYRQRRNALAKNFKTQQS
jgi:integrase